MTVTCRHNGSQSVAAALRCLKLRHRACDNRAATTPRFPYIGLYKVGMGDVTMADKKTASPGSWGRVADYLLGRNTLIGVASFMLLIISGYATWHGMRDFIIGVSTSPASQLPAAARRHVVLQRLAGHRRRRRAHLPDVADAARDVRRQAPLARAAHHLPALRVPRHLVDRLRLRLLVEPDRRRGGDAHGPCRPAGGRARRQRRGRRAPRCGARCSSTAS